MSFEPAEIELLVDDELRWTLPSTNGFPVRSRQEKEGANARVFLITSVTRLQEWCGVIRKLSGAGKLEALIIEADGSLHALPQLMHASGIRSTWRVLVHNDPSVVRRIVWSLDVTGRDELIATASLVGRELMLTTCTLEFLRCSADEFPGLRGLGDADLAKFQIDEDGSFLYWPEVDVHVSAEEVRYLAIPGERRRVERFRKAYDAVYGRAIRSVREKAGIRQSDIHGLTARQVRRIEQGMRPRLETLRLLAAAHQMDTGAYLDSLAGELRIMRSAVSG